MSSDVSMKIFGCFLAMAAAGYAQTLANNATSQSSAEIDTIVVSQVTQYAYAYHTEVRAHLPGLPPLYDISATVSASDPVFQNMVSGADNILSAAGVVSIQNPMLVINNSTVSSSTSSVLTPVSTTVVPVVTIYTGPISLSVGNFGVCQSYMLGSGIQRGPQLNSCNGGTATTLNVPAGAQDLDTLNISLVTINQTSTTTITTLTTQIWDVVGLLPGNNLPPPPVTTPAPPSQLLFFVGLSCLGLCFGVRRWRSA